MTTSNSIRLHGPSTLCADRESIMSVSSPPRSRPESSLNSACAQRALPPSRRSGMHRNLHVRFLMAVVLASLAAGVGCDKLRARDMLNKGVQAYKDGRFDLAVEDFKQARDLDPTLTSAQLYLATAYASQFVPGLPSQDNINNGQQAISEFKEILTQDPNNLAAIDGIGSILYSIGATPFDEGKLEESKSYHMRHIEIKAD